MLRFHSARKNVATLVRELSARPDVEYAEPNYVVHAIAVPNDPRFGELWGLQNTGQPILGVPGTPGADISAVPAWDISTGSRANVAAVVDTGIDYTHPDLAANVWSAPTAFTVTIGGRSITCPAGSHGFNAITNVCDPRDDNNHGSHVSGTIGAVGNNGLGVVGVNWTASIMGTKFLDATGFGTTANAINAIEFAIQAKGAFALTGAANVRVLSNSWGGGGFSQALLDEINRANANDMLFVAAANNNSSNNDVTPNYPSSYNAPNVVAVAATDNNDALASFSNFGATSVHLGAPGVNVLSTIIGANYDYFSGTSMATPHVSGAAILILSKCPLTTADLKTNILNNVDPIPSLAGITVTGGRLNVNKAIRACGALSHPSANSTWANAWAANRLGVFGLGLNRSMYHQWFTSQFGWGPSLTTWEFHSGGITGSPAVVSWAPDRLDILVVGTDQGVWHQWFTSQFGWGPSLTAWENHGNTFASGSPAAVSWGANRLDIFAVGVDGAIRHQWSASGAWQPSQTTWESLGGAFTGSPAAVSWGVNRLDVFAIGSGGTVQHRFWDGTAWQPAAWENLGGTFVGSPAAVSWGVNRLDVFAIGSDGTVQHRFWDGTAWQPAAWENLGGTFVGSPAAVSWGVNRLDVFAVGSDSGMQHRFWDGTAWQPWELHGGAFLTPSPR